ncbi:hypothetical protein E8E12_001895 [Didymella heteroderae]|uniref:Uncharacterized protein n=1 Tax=Didymella heteroderae TaxID=1769908 RepID=A0A9P5C3T2_9PLEO|nr:hypothetical protein E8E12_001895 [Didymella heteroderae]
MKRAAIVAQILATLTALAVSDATIRPLTSTTAKPFDNASSRIAVPFGIHDTVKFSSLFEPSLVATAETDWDPDDIATDATWAKYRAKGHWYGCLLDMKDELCGRALGDMRNPPSAESIWQGDLRQSILDWGWYDAFYDSDISCNFRDSTMDGVYDAKIKIQTALEALGLSWLPFGKGGDNECHSVEHYDENLLPDEGEGDYKCKNPFRNASHQVKLIEDQTYMVGGRSYPATGAYYRFAVNTRGGALFAQNMKKPQAAAEEELGRTIPENQLPHLQRASDIMWSYWERNNANPQNLRYYFVNYIKNDETLPLIARALRNHGLNTVPRWPGLELGMHTDEAEAILGSPVGATIAHLLLQHKSTFGVKNFGGITIFRDNYPEKYLPEIHLLFKIIDVPFDEQIDSDVEMPDADDVKAKRMEPVQEIFKDNGKSILREQRVVVGI